MDKVDLKLIKELQKDGRESYADLARMLGVVEGTVRKRIKRLLDQQMMKVIAIPNMPQMGYGLISVMGIQIRGAALREVTDILLKNRNVCYLAWVAGRYDLIAILITRSPQELSQIIEKEIRVIPSVERTETFVNMDIIKGAWGLMDTSQLVDSLDVDSK